MNTFIDRTGEEKMDKYGCLMRIIRYDNSRNIWVEFQDEHHYVAKTQYGDWTRNMIGNPYSKKVYGVGYLGLAKAYENGKSKQAYQIWFEMFANCYSKTSRSKGFEGYSVCKEWHSFEVFERWYNENIYSLDQEEVVFSKSLIPNSDRVFSPDTCAFIPKRLSCLFVTQEERRGSSPLGVYVFKNKYRAMLNENNGTLLNLGLFSTPEEAFQAYKNAKEDLVKKLAAQYKGILPENVYKALMEYQVEYDA